MLHPHSFQLKKITFFNIMFQTDAPLLHHLKTKVTKLFERNVL